MAIFDPAFNRLILVSGLDQRVSALVSAGWAPNTRTGYTSAVRRYLKFASSHLLQPLPVSETVILRYVAQLSIEGLAPTTIKSYLAAIRAWVIALGLSEPLIWTPRVHLAIRALNRSHLPRQPQPITYHILDSMISILTPSKDHLIIASALSLQYFACLRASELCSNLSQALAPTRSDIAFYHRTGGALVMTYRCHSSKTAPHGFLVHVGCSGMPACSPCIKRQYLSLFPLLPSHHLFTFSSGLPLTYNLYNSIIKQLVKALGLDPSLYSSHSLRAGAATQAHRSGLDPASIKRLGRWKSQAYLAYLRPPPESYAHLATALAPSHPPSPPSHPINTT